MALRQWMKRLPWMVRRRASGEEGYAEDLGPDEKRVGCWCGRGSRDGFATCEAGVEAEEQDC